MEFELATAGYFYPEKEKREKLEKLGFTFKPSDYKYFSIRGNPKIVFNSLEELMDFIKLIGEDVVVGDGTITIYDDYIE
jgi:hypothetical protein